MIKIENLTKKYGDLTVYENFNLEIEEGKVTCVLGESGSGKTTLLNCIAKLTEFYGDTPKLKCSYIFQTPRLLPNLTVKDNLKLICRDEEKIKQMLDRVRLSDKAACYPAELSGGQARRVSIARAFLYGGDILLMDEPFSSLDLKLKYEMYALFKELTLAYSVTTLFVTHEVGEAVTLADRVIVLKGGKIECDIVPEEQGIKETEKLLVSILTNGLTIS